MSDSKKEVLELINLTKNDILTYKKKYSNQILDTKIETTDEDKLCDASEQFWKNQANPLIDFKTYLYFMIEFVSGNLYSWPGHAGPLLSDHKNSSLALQKILSKGILTTNGQGPTKIQRSYLDFIIFTNNNTIDKIKELTNILFDRGVNVVASFSTKKGIEKRIILFQNEEILFRSFSLDTKNSIFTNPNQYNELTKTNSFITINLNNFHHEIKSILKIDPPEENYWDITIYSKKWNKLKVEEVLLASLKEAGM